MTKFSMQFLNNNVLSVLVSICLVFNVQAIELHQLIQDHMVLQRGQAFNLTGKTSPNKKVNVEAFGYQFDAFSQDDGTFIVTLPAQRAGGPYQLSVFTDEERHNIEDVYVGDVWLASGQSNMEWKFKWGVDDGAEAVATSDYPLIRYFDVKNRHLASATDALDTSDKWVVASPKVANEFSAVAWYFAQNLHLDKRIPVGIIDSSWGGTPAEAWTPAEVLLQQPGYRSSAQALIEQPDTWQTKFAHASELEKTKNQLLNSRDGYEKQQIASPELNDKEWRTIRLPSAKKLNDIIWLRKWVELKDVTTSNYLEFGWLPSNTQVYINDKALEPKQDLNQKGALSIPKEWLIAGKNLIAIRVANGWNNEFSFNHQNRYKLHTENGAVDLAGKWKVNTTLEGELPMPPKYWQKTSVLYNGMIQPLLGYPLKGVIWYQGESNDARHAEYHALFSSMIKAWREKWNQPNLPFVFAQLASNRAFQALPYDSVWAKLRQAQTDTLVLPHTAMATLIDAGDQWDIHPRNKKVVGERLYRAAKHVAYSDDIVYSGPMAQNVLVNGHVVTVGFDHIGEGLTSEGTIKSFAVAGADGKFVNAKAKIVGDTVQVWTAQISHPKWVQYGWSDYSDANLYNEEGLPAVPFRKEIK